MTRLRRARSAANGAADADAAILEHLRVAGSDLTRPHAAEFFLYLPSEAAAGAVADRFGSRGFTAAAHPSPSGPDWSCVPTESLVLDAGTLRRLRRDLTKAAAAYGGECDGWGAEVARQLPLQVPRQQEI